MAKDAKLYAIYQKTYPQTKVICEGEIRKNKFEGNQGEEGCDISKKISSNDNGKEEFAK